MAAREFVRDRPLRAAGAPNQRRIETPSVNGVRVSPGASS
jgi:hypothetical protein